jgi:hypothetical protein
MKKMNKTYEAPVAEVFEMNMPTVLMASATNPGVTWDENAGGFEG